MIGFIKEKETCWEYLYKSDKPIFIYGMGTGAEKILERFEEFKIPLAGFFASDGFVRGHSFKGHTVHTLKQVEEAAGEFIAVLAFAAGYRSLYDKINLIAKKHDLRAPDVPVAGEGLFTYDYCVKNAEKIQTVYESLADEKSREAFAGAVNFKISGKIDYLDKITSGREEIYKNLIKQNNVGAYVDLGAYDGDTAKEFIENSDGTRGHVYAFEPNAKNFKKLQKNLGGTSGVTLINAAAWDFNGTLSFSPEAGRNSAAVPGGKQTADCATVDALIKESAGIIKIDVEGAEKNAIMGAKRHIKNGSSVICSLYHRNEDLFEIPLLLLSINPKLKLYIRHHLYIPAWETNLYAVDGDNSD